MHYGEGDRGRLRLNLGDIQSLNEIPYLFQEQIDSYNKFTQRDTPPAKRGDFGLQGTLKSFFPIVSSSENVELRFLDYKLQLPTLSVGECIRRSDTYSSGLWIRLQVLINDKSSGEKKLVEIREEEVYMGDIPLMTNKGAFVVNGTERVVVAQLHRSPGVVFELTEDKTHSAKKKLYKSRIIPARGSWLEFEIDHTDQLCVRIDRRRKLPATVFLRALGMQDEEMLRHFFAIEKYDIHGEHCGLSQFIPDRMLDKVAGIDFCLPSGDMIVAQGEIIRKPHILAMNRAGIKSLTDLPLNYLVDFVTVKDIVDPKSKEVICPCNGKLTEVMLRKIAAAKIKSIETIYFNQLDCKPYLSDTLRVDKTKEKEDALKDIYRVMRPGDVVTNKAAADLFHNMFFNISRYDLSPVGRMKINHRFPQNLKKKSKKDARILESRVLENEDVLQIIQMLIDIRNGKEKVDDIDHLGNRRVRLVGEMVENQFRIGMSRIERVVKEKLSYTDVNSMKLEQVIIAKPISAAIKEFFGSSPLSQFMDQVNPLSEITHKRRISALGPGGLVRDRAGFEVRNIHPSHYGRICLVETPEGPNIGLINSLAIFASINEYGFIETPYRLVKNGKKTNKKHYLSALDEDQYVIAPSSPLGNGRGGDDLVSVRHMNEYQLRTENEIDYMDISPQQILSVSAALIPFLEHDDAKRALMGANMQRQSVPTLFTEAPLVGTGMERKAAIDSEACLVANQDGIVERIDSSRIVVRADKADISAGENIVDIYNLTKYVRSNQNTCINQKPIVVKNDRVKKDDVLADGHAVDLGELALGRNMRIALMPWYGYNFEDSILISRRVAEEDNFTSIHIQTLVCIARELTRGEEEITADIPNISDRSRNILDESGIVYIGAEVKTGDILVGKVAPREDTRQTPEEKLLYAIFGEKASSMKDTSLRVPPSVQGKVIDVQVFTRPHQEKDQRTVGIEQEKINGLHQDRDDAYQIMTDLIMTQVGEVLKNKIVANTKEGVKKGEKLNASVLDNIDHKKWFNMRVTDEKTNEQVKLLQKQLKDYKKKLDDDLQKQTESVQQGDDLPPGVIKIVKVSLAERRNIQAGDKMAGRHGNKGVISAIIPTEDMPYDDEGNPVDIVLNPLGVSSRMNIGQILEMHLGLAAKGLGKKIQHLIQSEKNLKKARTFATNIYNKYQKKAINFSTLSDEQFLHYAQKWYNGFPMASPVFSGVNEKDVQNLLKIANQPVDGRMTLYDGRTGEKFDRPVTVGYMYIMKLNHLVDDKMHARSTGSYSLVIQQPLSGKAHFGGQRFGEMEVWALEAYGAAHVLQEMLTVKSDDIAGRSQMYKSIIEGNVKMNAGMPESFNVLVKEIRALGVNIKVEAE